MLKKKKLYFTYRGRVSLNILLKSAGVKKNDSVAVQSFTCSAVIEAIIALKAHPIFIDINKNDLIIDDSDLLRKIKNKKVKAVIVQYTFGIYRNINKISDFCKKNNIFLIEDCCHISPNVSKGNSIGSFGDASFFSFEWGKPIVGGIGGAFFLNNNKVKKKTEELYYKLHRPSIVKEILIFLQYYFYKIFYSPKRYWLLKDLFNFLSKKKIIIGNFSKKNIYQTSHEFKLKSLIFSELIVKRKLKNLRKRIRYSSELVKRVNNFYQKNKIRNLIVLTSDKSKNLLRLPIYIKDKKKILEYSRKNNIEVASWYISPIHPYKLSELKSIKYKINSCPNAEEMSKHIISLPINIDEKSLKLFFNYVQKNEI